MLTKNGLLRTERGTVKRTLTSAYPLAATDAGSDDNSRDYADDDSDDESLF